MNNYVEQMSSYGNQVSTSLSAANDKVSKATDSINTANSHKTMLGGALEGAGAFTLTTAKIINKATGLGQKASAGMDEIKGAYNTYKTNSAASSEGADAAAEVPFRPGATIGEEVPNAAFDPSGADVAPASGTEGGAAAGAEGADAGVEVGAEVGTEAAVETGLEVAGAALTATGVGAVVGVGLEVAAVVGTVVSGLIDLFSPHEKPPSPKPPDLSGYALPSLQLGVN